MSKIPDLVKKAKDSGMISCAITDHEVAYGQVDFYKKKGTRRHLFTNYVRFSKFEALELYEITPFSNIY